MMQYGTLNVSKSGHLAKRLAPGRVPPPFHRATSGKRLTQGAIVLVRSLHLKRLNPYGISFTSAEKLMTVAVQPVIHD